MSAGSTARREISAEPRPPGGGVEGFDTDAALEINEVRLTHLASLDLPIDGHRLLEVGAGVGRLTNFFIDRGCSVVATEARSENVAATDPPDHPDYHFSWLDNMDTARDGALLRSVFVASRTPLQQRGLKSLLG